jgi:hypothetical protein
MADQITISKTLSIRDCGCDEYWLQNEIEKNPSILGLGDLTFVHREKQQSSGGKLDFLLKDTTGNGMYEVEVMLGATDESHIIRALEYWDLERRRWPKKSHTAVLVAEKINRRFFNVIQLLSLTIPVIAVQVNIVEVGGTRVLHFTTILDAYEEPEVENRKKTGTFNDGLVDENYWKSNAPWALSHAKQFEKIAAPVVGRLESTFHEDAIRLFCNGEVYFRFNRSRRANQTSFYTWVKNEVKSNADTLLHKGGVSYNLRRYDAEWQELRLAVGQNLIGEKPKVFRRIAEFVKESWLS